MKQIILKSRDRKFEITEDVFSKFLIKPIFLLLIFFGFYSRTEGFLGLSGGQLSVLLSFGLFSFSILHFLFFKPEKRLSIFAWIITLFFVISGIVPLLASFIFGAEPMRVLRYSVEIGITFFMFFSTYYLIREGIISIKFFIFSLAFLGFLASFPLFYDLVGSIRIRRAGGLGGSNYLGSSFALAAISWVVFIYMISFKDESKRKLYFYFFCFLVTVLALLLTGTRAGALAFLVGIFLFQVFGMQSKNFTKYFFIVVGVIIVMFIYISLNIDLTLLLNRYSYEQLSYMASIRFQIYEASVTDLTLLDFLFGRPDFYIFSDSDEGINPHNMFLGIIRYNGLIPFILIIAIFGIVLYKYFNIFLLHSKKNYYRAIESTIIVLLTMIFIYTMLSGGRITRSFAFFVILGYVVGYFELIRSIKTYNAYKKLLF